VHYALHAGAVVGIQGILLTARAVQLFSEFCKPSEQTSCRQLSTLVSLDRVTVLGLTNRPNPLETKTSLESNRPGRFIVNQEQVCF
jgi:hypothetical protein